MKKETIIEEGDIICMSTTIAESIITYSEKFYGFKMLSRNTQAEISSEEMEPILILVIKSALEAIL